MAAWLEMIHTESLASTCSCTSPLASIGNPDNEVTPRNGIIDTVVGVAVADGTGINVEEGADVAIWIDVAVVVDVGRMVGITGDVLDGTEVTVDC